MQYPYLNGAVGQKDTDVELYILLLHYRRTPNPENNFEFLTIYSSTGQHKTEYRYIQNNQY
jgi:hypothetical protein